MQGICRWYVNYTCAYLFLFIEAFPGRAMVFPLEDLKTATNNFSADDLIGEGGFGKIYKGRLRYLDVAL